jgi:hypothetical protein
LSNNLDFDLDASDSLRALQERAFQPLSHQITSDLAVSASGDDTHPSSTSITPRKPPSVVTDTNLRTKNLEFYGSASSIAFLRHVETLSDSHTTGLQAPAQETSWTSLAHTPDSTSQTSQVLPATLQEAGLNRDRFHFRVARRFLDSYFSSIHFIQPLFEEEDFLSRCEDLWFEKPGKQPLSFVALYYATLSLGSLLAPYESSERSGADRFTWGRKLFNAARDITTQLGTATDLEMVQTYYMMVSSRKCKEENH